MGCNWYGADRYLYFIIKSVILRNLQIKDELNLEITWFDFKVLHCSSLILFIWFIPSSPPHGFPPCVPPCYPPPYPGSKARVWSSAPPES